MHRLRLPRTPIRCGGYDTWYADLGEGPPLLLIPSMLVRVESYEPLIARLGRSRRVVSVQPPGSGHAQRVERPWTFEQYAAWIREFIRLIGLERPSLLGHSNSAAAVAIAAAQDPDGCSSLILADAAGFDASRSLARILAGRAIDAIIEWRLSLAKWHHLAGNALWHTRNAWRQAELSAEADLRPILSRIRARTLLAWGARDHTIPVRTAEAIHRALPCAQLVVHPAGSHDWLITHAREFASIVDRFLCPAEHKSRAEWG